MNRKGTQGLSNTLLHSQARKGCFHEYDMHVYSVQHLIYLFNNTKTKSHGDKYFELHRMQINTYDHRIKDITIIYTTSIVQNHTYCTLLEILALYPFEEVCCLKVGKYRN